MAKQGSDGQMTFPILFDLDGAVQQAGQEWDKKQAKRLEDIIQKRPLKVKLSLESNISKFDDLKKN